MRDKGDLSLPFLSIPLGGRTSQRVTRAAIRDMTISPFAPIASLLFLGVFSSAAKFAPPKGHSVIVTIDDGNQGINTGNADRARFDLIEDYFPLSRASTVGQLSWNKDTDILLSANSIEDLTDATMKGSAESERPLSTDRLVSGPEESSSSSLPTLPRCQFFTGRKIGMQTYVVDGEWREWGKWSACRDGARVRTRVCVSRHVAWKVTCQGESKQSIPCFDTVKQTAVAADPWTIEKEIIGDRFKI